MALSTLADGHVADGPFDKWSDDVSVFRRYGPIANIDKFQRLVIDFNDLDTSDFEVLGGGEVRIPWFYKDPASGERLPMFDVDPLNARQVLAHVMVLAASLREHRIAYGHRPPAYLRWTAPRRPPLLLESWGPL